MNNNIDSISKNLYLICKKNLQHHNSFNKSKIEDDVQNILKNPAKLIAINIESSKVDILFSYQEQQYSISVKANLKK